MAIISHGGGGGGGEEGLISKNQECLEGSFGTKFLKAHQVWWGSSPNCGRIAGQTYTHIQSSIVIVSTSEFMEVVTKLY